MHDERAYPIDALCDIAKVARSSYYKWLSHKPSKHEEVNLQISELLTQINEEYPDMGYRRLQMELERNYSIKANEKRVLRLCRIDGIKSNIKYPGNGCTKHASKPDYLGENILNRDFEAESPNTKWLTDVSEFKYYVNGVKHKLYLSPILDLYDGRIVAFKISDHNNNQLVFDTFNAAIDTEPTSEPLFHSDRGIQYTSKQFRKMIMDANMTQSMSRVGKCIDNAPMEGFFGMLKRERYYGKNRRFTSREALVEMIEKYIHYYNYGRFQKGLGKLTPMEKNQQFYQTAA